MLRRSVGSILTGIACAAVIGTVVKVTILSGGGAEPSPTIFRTTADSYSEASDVRRDRPPGGRVRFSSDSSSTPVRGTSKVGRQFSTDGSSTSANPGSGSDADLHDPVVLSAEDIAWIDGDELLSAPPYADETFGSGFDKSGGVVSSSDSPNEVGALDRSAEIDVEPAYVSDEIAGDEFGGPADLVDTGAYSPSPSNEPAPNRFFSKSDDLEFEVLDVLEALDDADDTAFESTSALTDAVPASTVGQAAVQDRPAQLVIPRLDSSSSADASGQTDNSPPRNDDTSDRAVATPVSRPGNVVALSLLGPDEQPFARTRALFEDDYIGLKTFTTPASGFLADERSMKLQVTGRGYEGYPAEPLGREFTAERPFTAISGHLAVGTPSFDATTPTGVVTVDLVVQSVPPDQAGDEATGENGAADDDVLPSVRYRIQVDPDKARWRVLAGAYDAAGTDAGDSVIGEAELVYEPVSFSDGMNAYGAAPFRVDVDGAGVVRLRLGTQALSVRLPTEPRVEWSRVRLALDLSGLDGTVGGAEVMLSDISLDDIPVEDLSSRLSIRGADEAPGSSLRLEGGRAVLRSDAASGARSGARVSLITRTDQVVTESPARSVERVRFETRVGLSSVMAGGDVSDTGDVERAAAPSQAGFLVALFEEQTGETTSVLAAGLHFQPSRVAGADAVEAVATLTRSEPDGEDSVDWVTGDIVARRSLGTVLSPDESREVRIELVDDSVTFRWGKRTTSLPLAEVQRWSPGTDTDAVGYVRAGRGEELEMQVDFLDLSRW